MHLLVGAQRAAGERAGHDGAAALRREHAIDPQPRPAVGCRWRLAHQLERSAQIVDPRAGGRAHRHDRGIGQERSAESIADLQLLQLAPFVVDQIDLGEGDDPVADPDQLEDAQVLLALRLPALRGGDHEHARIDTADTGQHVAQEPHVTGHVDEADAGAAGGWCGRSRGRWSARGCVLPRNDRGWCR